MKSALEYKHLPTGMLTPQLSIDFYSIVGTLNLKNRRNFHIIFDCNASNDEHLYTLCTSEQITV